MHLSLPLSLALLSIPFLSTSLAGPLSSPTVSPTPAPLMRFHHRHREYERQIGASVLSSGSIPQAVPSGLLANASQASVIGGGSAGGNETGWARANSTAMNSSLSSTMSTSANSTTTSSSLYSTTTTASWSAANATSSSSANETSSGSADIIVLNLAFVLENLEADFYSKALSTFSVDNMVSAGLSRQQATVIVEQITEIQIDEATHGVFQSLQTLAPTAAPAVGVCCYEHQDKRRSSLPCTVSILSETILALGGQPFQGCSFNFDAALTDPITFLSVARTLELVGVSAYLGAVHLISDPQLLTAAGSIMTIEARHQSLLNTFNAGSFGPQSFDISLSPQGVLALAGGFLQNCQASDLGLTSNNPLSISDTQSNSTRFQMGTQLAFASILQLDLSTLTCQMITGGLTVALTFPANACIVPSGINGPVAVYLTNTSTPLATDIIVQDTLTVVAGPDFIFVDSQTTLLSSLFAVSSSSSSSSSNSNSWQALPSADLGGYYMAKMRGGESWDNVVIVRDTGTDTDSDVVVVDY
ncbi:SPOSA6832_01636 [Sporobolomyces salmonicolor]|uniref:SPOSA6832_01636-mRNA-1:cds n=1 Tax=Sporidiobolus salmonicolor TaxID=5005 RepID=A0A0D6EJ67_SPOSA|nr:SPOSA6832_01636 [Sporobolomyces salmonicolor]